MNNYPNSKPRFSDEEFEKIFASKKKKVPKNQPNQEGYDLISDFISLRINDNHNYIQERQPEKKMITPNMENLLLQSPIPDEVFDESQNIDFKNIMLNNPEFVESVAKDISEQYESQKTNINTYNQTVVGLFDDQVPTYMLPPKDANEYNEDEKIVTNGFDCPELLVNLNNMVPQNYVLTSSDEATSESDSNAERDGAYPSDYSNEDNNNFYEEEDY
ncbi:hypothetical protein M9Y10_023296 [Tritrichomonas musculus]|uniref:Uncharacterized protein n=1 Tax=Tritrichomonas musculus TaxID=1915356 RepID=A0ABR2KVR1_9EUKA